MMPGRRGTESTGSKIPVISFRFPFFRYRDMLRKEHEDRSIAVGGAG